MKKYSEFFMFHRKISFLSALAVWTVQAHSPQMPTSPYCEVLGSFFELSGGVVVDHGKISSRTYLKSTEQIPTTTTPVVTSKTTATTDPVTPSKKQNTGAISIAIGHDRDLKPQCSVSPSLGFEVRYTQKFKSGRPVSKNFTTSDDKVYTFAAMESLKLKNNSFFSVALRPGIRLQKTFLYLILGLNMPRYKGAAVFKDGSTMVFQHRRRIRPSLGIGINQSVTDRVYLGMSYRVHFGQNVNLAIKSSNLQHAFDRSLMMTQKGTKHEITGQLGYRFGQ